MKGALEELLRLDTLINTLKSRGVILEAYVQVQLVNIEAQINQISLSAVLKEVLKHLT